MVISIHTFLTEGDYISQSETGHSVISIHTFLTEGDAILPSWPDKHIHFNPHLPCRRWQQQQLTMCMIFLFQSTPSLQKVTWIEDSYTVSVTISIHTFLAEGDLVVVVLFGIWRISIHTFLAEGDCTGSVTSGCSPISIHTFLAEGDGALDFMDEFHVPISIHTFLAEGDSN